jgi:hypothetical protein
MLGGYRLILKMFLSSFSKRTTMDFHRESSMALGGYRGYIPSVFIIEVLLTNTFMAEEILLLAYSCILASRTRSHFYFF